MATQQPRNYSLQLISLGVYESKAADIKKYILINGP
jgi:hypothetical protein